MTGAFEILSIDTAQKRIGIALVDEGSSRAAAGAPSAFGAGAAPSDTPRARRPARRRAALAPGAIVTGKIERHEKFGVIVFLSPGRTGLMPFAETGVERDADMLKAFPVGSDVEVVVLEIDPASRRIRAQQEGGCGATGAGGTARVHREAGRRARGLDGINGRQAARRAQGALKPARLTGVDS